MPIDFYEFSFDLFYKGMFFFLGVIGLFLMLGSSR
tara:strand:+ start:123 stop:227 length:105 start_codon:yes stop_codon:yes gene_type:complete